MCEHRCGRHKISIGKSKMLSIFKQKTKKQYSSLSVIKEQVDNILGLALAS